VVVSSGSVVSGVGSSIDVLVVPVSVGSGSTGTTVSTDSGSDI